MRLALVLATLFVLATSRPAPTAPRQVVNRPAPLWQSDFASAQAEARRRGVPLLVHFHAAWCGPCRRMERDVLESAGLRKRLANRVVAVRVDTDRARRVTARFRVRLLPTDVLISPAGKELARTQGYQSLRGYLLQIGSAVDRYRAAHPPAAAEPPAAVPPAKTPALALPSAPRLGLRGYSPVTLWTAARWQKGETKFACRVGNVVYRLASAEELKQFRQDPVRFAPRLAGLDAVRLLEAKQQVAGDIRHAVFYDGGLYLFSNAASLAKFRQDPRRYSQARRPVATRPAADTAAGPSRKSG